MNRTRILLVAASLLAGLLVARWLAPMLMAPPAIVVELDSGIEPTRVLGEPVIDPASLEPLVPEKLIPRLPWTSRASAYFWPQLAAQGDNWEPHPILGARRRPGFAAYQRHGEHPDGGYPIRCNSLGMRDDEPLAEPDLRILVAGDSQTEGVCANGDSFCNLWEQQLRKPEPNRGAAQDRAVEVINAGQGGSSPWSYLNTFEAYADLQPDVFAAVFFGGNDFRGALELERYHRQRGPGRGRGRQRLRSDLGDLPPGAGPQELQQAVYFLDNPADRVIAVKVWVSLTMELQRQCTAAGTELRLIYLPPAYNAQASAFQEELNTTKANWPELAQEIADLDLLVDAWIADLAEQQIDVLDLRPVFQTPSRLFWRGDLHLNLEGHRQVAAALARWAPL